MTAYLASSIGRKTIRYFGAGARAFLGLGKPSSDQVTAWSRVGLASSGLFLVANGVWILVASGRLPLIVPVFMIGIGTIIILVSWRKRLTLLRTNLLSLVTHMSALFTFYFLATRFLTVTYSTDTIISTYAGLAGVLQLQNPYLYSIKPFLEQFGFPPSYYTPRVDGSFEFDLVYPAFNFLSLVPLYLAGLHDLRDGVLFFHILSVLLIFGVVPARAKAISLAPFAFGFPLAIVFSWTDSVWAFLLLLSTVFWHRDRRLSLLIVGLAGATKQIALVAAPFLLIRLFHETPAPKPRRVLIGSGALLAGFLVPNLPFILSSPSAWWAGTVSTYLPGNAPQVAGGVGLSEVLIDLGISPPPFFFIALMGVVAAWTIYIYSRSFSRLQYFIWAMPALILFFYYRSFPNYIAYWLIPLLPELVRYRPWALRTHEMRPEALSMHRSIRFPSLRIRSRLAPSTLIVLVVVVALAGVSGAYISRASEPRVEFRIDRMLDPDDLGATTSLEVTLVNPGSDPLSPRFFVKWSFLPFLWTADSTTLVAPGATGHYVLTATDARAAIPQGAPFRVLVFNSLDGNLVSQSVSLHAEHSNSGILNPLFRWWTLDSATGRKVPFGWQLFLDDTNPSSGIEELEGASSGGVRLRLNHTSDEGREMIRVSQKIPFDASGFRMLTLQPPDTDRRVLFGTKFTDGLHTLYFIFSQTATSRTVSVNAENTTITTPVELGKWAWIPVDASYEWSLQGWPLPRTWEFSIFLQAGSKGVFYGYVKEIG